MPETIEKPTIWNKEIFVSGELVGNAIYLYDVRNTINKRQAMFICRECGSKFIAQVYKIKIEETRSCGCLQSKNTSKANTKHGLLSHPLYGVWKSMKGRCYNSNVSQYKDYGGRSVVVCDEWKDNFIEFYKWGIKNGWDKNKQLDKDIKGSSLIYSPDTCSFVSAKKNSNKRRSSRFIEYKGDIKTVSEWADYFNISLKNLYQRMSRGWSFEKCITYGENT